MKKKNAHDELLTTSGLGTGAVKGNQKAVESLQRSGPGKAV